MTEQSELKTIGLTPAIYCADQALFHVTRGVPLGDALSMASDFLFLAKALTEDAAYARDTDRHAWAAHYLTSMSKALVGCGEGAYSRSDLCAGIQAGGG
jgi:hypothetical protein